MLNHLSIVAVFQCCFFSVANESMTEGFTDSVLCVHIC